MASGGGGAKVVTIKEVAELAGVSIGTVSRFSHEPHRVHVDTRTKIQKAIDDLGYAPNTLARNFRMGSTGVVLVLVSTLGDPFYGSIIDGIVRIADLRGYGVHIQKQDHTRMSGRQLSEIIHTRQADGIIVLGSYAPLLPDSKDDPSVSHPAIVVCGETSDPDLLRYPRFQIDGCAAAEELTNYLIGLGHRRVGFFRGHHGPVEVTDREAGFRAAMARAAIEIHEELIVAETLDLVGGRRATQEVLNASIKPTAIVCANDEMAFGTMSELQRRGLSVPADISVVGFDDTRYADAANPPLTTIAQPAMEIGERSMYSLLNAIKSGERKAFVELLPHRLIVRRSAAPPAQDSR